MVARWRRVDDAAARREFGGGVHPEIEARIEGMDPEVPFLLRMWRHHEAGFLPCAGGVLDQPNRLLEAIEIIGGEVARVSEAEAARARRRSESGFGDGSARPRLHGGGSRRPIRREG